MNFKTKLIIDKYLGGFCLVFIKVIAITLGRLLRLDHALPNLKTGKNITIIKYLGGGSLAIAYPALLALRKAGFRMRLITSPAVVPFAEVLAVFDDIFVIDDGSLPRMISSTLKLLFHFQSETCIDLELHSNISCILTCFYGFKNRIGFYLYDSFWRRGIYTHGLYYNPASSIAQAYDRAARLLTAERSNYEESKLFFRNSFTSSAFAFHGYVAVAPGCSQLGRERQLYPDEWVKLLKEETRPVVILGGREDAGIGDIILQHRNGKNLAGQLALKDSLTILFSCEKLYCIDSALLHYARLWGTPVESWWGPTNPAHRISGAEQIHQSDLFHYKAFSCSPCVHIAAKCPCTGSAECMRAFASRQDTNPIRGFGNLPIANDCKSPHGS